MFKKLTAAGLKLKLSKCELFKTQSVYLAHIISKDGIETDPKKIAAIKQWLQPTTETDVHSFLVFTNHYRQFIPLYAQIAKPINSLAARQNANKTKKM